MNSQVDSVKNKLKKYKEILATYIVKKRMVKASKTYVRVQANAK